MFTGQGRYTFTSVYIPDRCIDIPSPIAHREEGNVQQFTVNGSTYQKWMVIEDPAGGFFIQSILGPSKVLGIEADSREDNAKIFFQRPNGSPFQRWRIVPAGNDAYRIVNMESAYCIDLRHEARHPGGYLQQRPILDVPHQLWCINPA